VVEEVLPISVMEERRRWRRIRRLAKQLGFEGELEYRHTMSRTGGAQYQIGSMAELDRLVVFALAFQRDADPEDFSLTAILAHERRHQLLHRHSRRRLARHRTFCEIQGDSIYDWRKKTARRQSKHSRGVCEEGRGRESLAGRTNGEAAPPTGDERCGIAWAHSRRFGQRPSQKKVKQKKDAGRCGPSTQRSTPMSLAGKGDADSF